MLQFVGRDVDVGMNWHALDAFGQVRMRTGASCRNRLVAVGCRRLSATKMRGISQDGQLFRVLGVWDNRGIKPATTRS